MLLCAIYTCARDMQAKEQSEQMLMVKDNELSHSSSQVCYVCVILSESIPFNVNGI